VGQQNNVVTRLATSLLAHNPLLSLAYLPFVVYVTYRKILKVKEAGDAIACKARAKIL
jgi:hypothetical protein